MNASVTLSQNHTSPRTPLAAVGSGHALDLLADQQPRLAEAFRAGWNTPAAEWAGQQFAPPPSPHFEAAFRQALVEELAHRCGPEAAERLVQDVESAGVVLTPHHICPTPGPTFGAIDTLASYGATGPVLVLAWSGVPMSNSACSGALCFARSAFEDLMVPGPERSRQQKAAKDRARDGVVEQRISLVPSALRDALLFECPVPDRLAEVRAAAAPGLAALMPEPSPADTYASWAARMAEAIQRHTTGRQDLWYVDLNRVARRYLLKVLPDPGHPVTRLLMEARELPDLEGLSWFYGRRPGKREKVTTLFEAPDAVD